MLKKSISVDDSIDKMKDESTPEKRKRIARKIWHYKPDQPVRQAPYFEFPFSLINSLKYLYGVWRPFSQRFWLLLIAIGIWNWFTPSFERAASFELDWMLEIALRNLVIVLVVAGGLHLFLFTFRRQADDLRYDARPLSKKSKTFHFGNQVWDNMFWTLVGAVPIGTLWECLMLWGYANGHATLITFSDNSVWFIGLMLLVPIWSGLHFYVFHRILHIGPLYKWVHSWHHKNVNTGPWSGHAMHPVEHVLLYSDVSIYFLVPSHPVHMIFNLLLHTIAGPTSHCGYERVKLNRYMSIEIGDFMHQLHHRFIDCNFGSYETPWDKVFGSFHDGTEAGDRYINERRRRLYQLKNQMAK
jgi:lathosterol oxidase